MNVSNIKPGGNFRSWVHFETTTLPRDGAFGGNSVDVSAQELEIESPVQHHNTYFSTLLARRVSRVHHIWA